MFDGGWDYRVMRRTGETDAELFSIIEAYYDADGHVVAWANDITPYGDTLEDLQSELRLMTEAATRPVLDWADLPKGNGNG